MKPTRKRKPKPKAKPKSKPAPVLYIGLSAESAKIVVDGLSTILTMTKDNPSLAIEAVRVFASAVQVKDVSISNCVFQGRGGLDA